MLLCRVLSVVGVISYARVATPLGLGERRSSSNVPLGWISYVLFTQRTRYDLSSTLSSCT